MILKKLSPCLGKLEPGFQTYGLIGLLGPSFPKLVFSSQTPDVTALGSKIFFMSSSIIFCMKQAFIFKFWFLFDKVMSVFSQKLAKNLSKVFFLLPFQIVLFKSCLKKTPFFGALKFKYLRKRLTKFKK